MISATTWEHALDFYSTYWYSDPTTVSQPATLKRLQADLTADLAAQARGGGT